MTDYFPWFRFRAADFIGGTAGMTMEERGAYITLLCHQWMHGPLPADPQDLARICGGVTVSKRVTDKFRNVEGTPHCINDKLEEDREHALKSRDCSKKRQRKHKKAKGKSNALPERDETVTKPLPSISNTTVGSMGEPSKPKSKRKTKAEHAASYAPDIAAIVMAYPKVASPSEANDVWTRMVDRPPLELVLVKIEENKKWNKSWKDGFICDLVVWLNQKRWEGKVVPDTLSLGTEDPNALF